VVPPLFPYLKSFTKTALVSLTLTSATVYFSSTVEFKGGSHL